MLRAGMLPAIHPLQCCGVELPGEQASHVAQSARARLAELRRVHPALRPDLASLEGEQRVRIGRALRLPAYLTQPFHGTEPFVGRPGVSVPRAQALQRVAAILDGSFDDVDSAKLLYGQQ